MTGTNVKKIKMAEFHELYPAHCAATPKYIHVTRIIFKHFLVVLKITITNLTTSTYSYCLFFTNLIHKFFISVHLLHSSTFFDVLLTVHLSIFFSVINQLDAKLFCFTITLFHASTCFEHMCSSSGDQNCITQPLVSSHL